MESFTLPPDFIKKMQKLLLAEWEEFENCYRNNRYQGLRFNPLKKGLYEQDYKRLLIDLGIWEIEPVLWAEHAYYYPEEARPGKHPYHEAGLYYIQEPSAMCAAALLAPSPGERVLDLCAAPGGKSTQLASFLKQEGLLICNEIHPARCKILSQNIERMGIGNAIVTNEDSEALAERFPEYFHKILVDAPCSGEGMFRKNPEAALEWNRKQVGVCAERQLEILENAAKMLMYGGIMLYSTCTFSPEENEGVIGDFLEAHPEFSVVYRENRYFSCGNPEWGNGRKDLADTFRLWPHRLKGEGHFAALLQKNRQMGMENEVNKSIKINNDLSWNIKIDNSLNRNVKINNGLNRSIKADNSSNRKAKTEKNLNKNVKKDKKIFEELKKFTSETLTDEMEEYILSGEFTLFGEQLYRLPAASPELSGLRVLRPGLHIGSFVKNSFKPSHALALFLGREEVKNSVLLSLSDIRAKMYYNGEALDCEGLQIDGNGGMGWCLVCINGYSVGWGKIAGGMVKNHYPKGLRKEVVYG